MLMTIEYMQTFSSIDIPDLRKNIEISKSVMSLAGSCAHSASGVVASADDFVAANFDAADAVLVADEQADLIAVLNVPDSDSGISRARDGYWATIEYFQASNGRIVPTHDMQTFAVALSQLWDHIWRKRLEALTLSQHPKRAHRGRTLQ